nr:MAG TPA: hypothetical protein [Caudoviricetes sp.]
MNPGSHPVTVDLPDKLPGFSVVWKPIGETVININNKDKGDGMKKLAGIIRKLIFRIKRRREMPELLRMAEYVNNIQIDTTETKER